MRHSASMISLEKAKRRRRRQTDWANRGACGSKTPQDSRSGGRDFADRRAAILDRRGRLPVGIHDTISSTPRHQCGCACSILYGATLVADHPTRRARRSRPALRSGGADASSWSRQPAKTETSCVFAAAAAGSARRPAGADIAAEPIGRRRRVSVSARIGAISATRTPGT
jgi:hypothetical protein